MIKKSVMRIGATGLRVEEAQKLLRLAGSTIQVNGVYSIGMYSAVKSFQKKNGLPATGVIDPKTMDKLLMVRLRKPVRKRTKK